MSRTCLYAAALLLALAGCGGDDDDSATPGNGGGSGGSQAGSGGANAGNGGSGGGGSGSGGSSGLPSYPTDGSQTTSTKLDLLFVVDNSISMADKQTVLALSIPHLLRELVAGSADRAPVQDLHVGVITSSLGGHGGADVCSSPTTNDRAQLLPTLARLPGMTSYQGLGFHKYAPADANAMSDVEQLSSSVVALMQAAGETGCGYEATLEAAYRFLVDPAPPLDVTNNGSVTVTNGIDSTLLAQRAAFLRPDSAVQVVFLSDENDCSIRDSSVGWVLATTTGQMLPRATAACAGDPNAACCSSCGSPDVAGCTPHAEDPNCQLGPLTPTEDVPNLRCFGQKRRYGIDLLHPISRYAVGFSEPMICPSSSFGDADCQCRLAALNGGSCVAGAAEPNPLFAGGRHPSLVSVAAIVGVPWQDLAVDPSDAVNTDLLDASALSAMGRWNAIAGVPELSQEPSDPYMRESVEPRSGTNPVTGAAIASDAAAPSPINGHDRVLTTKDDLQYACTFELPEVRDCLTVGESSVCDCSAGQLSGDPQDPVCLPPGGTSYGNLQYYAKAYPGLRTLALARYLDTRAVVGSICSSNVTDQTQPNYAHHQSVRAILARLGDVLE